LVGVVGTRPPHLRDASDRDKAIPIEQQFIDVGLSEETVRKLVRVGDLAIPRRRVRELADGRLAGKAFDDRAGVAALYEAAVRLSSVRHECDVYLVATVMEEVGLRGAMVSTYSLVPEIGIAIDVGFAEYPGQDRAADDLKYGEGPGVGIGANIHPEIHRLLKTTADEHKIPCQLDPMPSRSGTDAWAMQVTRAGIPTGILSIPVRYMHTSVEVVATRDIVETGRLLAHFASRVSWRTVEGLQYG
jgi:endoglucanase